MRESWPLLIIPLLIVGVFVINAVLGPREATRFYDNSQYVCRFFKPSGLAETEVKCYKLTEVDQLSIDKKDIR